MVEAIFALNLDPIKLKLMDSTERRGWTREQADRAELEYRQFLALVAKYPDQSIAPTSEADKFWHGHILDTMKYAEDCQNVFGYFLHHFPSFGMRGDDDKANLDRAFENMRRLREEEFGTQAAATGTAWSAAAYGEATAGAGKDTARYAAVTGEAVETSEENAAWCAEATAELIAAAYRSTPQGAAVSGTASTTAETTA